MMRVTTLSLPGVRLIAPDAFQDERGWFSELYRAERYRAAGITDAFVQDNVSVSARGVIRGLHLQEPKAQAKLVSVVQGEVFDVAVDVRVGSPSFGRWVGTRLSAANHHQLLIPEGFAHGFAVLSELAIVHYKCTRAYEAEAELTVRWDDPDLAIDWPVRDPILSAKDSAGRRLRDIDPARLPRVAAPVDA
jgi:dTDP-4-dehydrorhamnose 3,5-epimerase